MIEAYPKYTNQDKLEANLNKLVSAFLMVAEDLVAQETQDEYGEEKAVLGQAPITKQKPLESVARGIRENSASYIDPLQTSLLSAVRSESKRNKSKTLKT